MRTITVLILAVSCFPFSMVPAKAAGAGAKIGILSPAPLWPENGDTSAYPSQHVFFNPRANEYVITYPSTDSEGQSVVLHVPAHRMVQPTVTASVARTADGNYQYSYSVSNGELAWTPIDSIMLVLEQRTLATKGQHDTWPSTASADRPIGVNLNSAGTLRWVSPMGQEIKPGATGTSFTIVSDLAPGYALMSFRGKSDLPELDPLQISKLPADVQTQLLACKSLGWDTQVQQVIGPRFDGQAPVEAIAVNFRYGINKIDPAQRISPKSTTLLQLNEILEAAALGIGSLSDSILEPLKISATDEQKKAIGALELTLSNAQSKRTAVQ